MVQDILTNLALKIGSFIGTSLGYLVLLFPVIIWAIGQIGLSNFLKSKK